MLIPAGSGSVISYQCVSHRGMRTAKKKRKKENAQCESTSGPKFIRPQTSFSRDNSHRGSEADKGRYHGSPPGDHSQGGVTAGVGMGRIEPTGGVGARSEPSRAFLSLPFPSLCRLRRHCTDGHRLSIDEPGAAANSGF